MSNFGWLLWPPSRAVSASCLLPATFVAMQQHTWVCLRWFVIFPMENPPYALSKSKHRREPAYRFRCRFPPSVQTYAEKTNERYAEKVWSTLIGEMIQISFAHVWHCPPSVKSPHVLVSHGGVIKQHPACLVIFFEWMRNANSLLVCVANEEFALNVAIMPFGDGQDGRQPKGIWCSLLLSPVMLPQPSQAWGSYGSYFKLWTERSDECLASSGASSEHFWWKSLKVDGLSITVIDMFHGSTVSPSPLSTCFTLRGLAVPQGCFVTAALYRTLFGGWVKRGQWTSTCHRDIPSIVMFTMFTRPSFWSTALGYFSQISTC